MHYVRCRINRITITITLLLLYTIKNKLKSANPKVLHLLKSNGKVSLEIIQLPNPSNSVAEHPPFAKKRAKLSENIGSDIESIAFRLIIYDISLILNSEDPISSIKNLEERK